jgi:hypothetical protein
LVTSRDASASTFLYGYRLECTRWKMTGERNHSCSIQTQLNWQKSHTVAEEIE